MAKFYISITTYRTELLLTHFNQKTHFLFVFDINYKPLFVVMVYYPNHSYTQRITYTHACARARAHAHARTRIHTHIVPETPTNCCERTNFKRSSLNMRNITRQKVNHYHHWIPHLDSLPQYLESCVQFNLCFTLEHLPSVQAFTNSVTSDGVAD